VAIGALLSALAAGGCGSAASSTSAGAPAAGAGAPAVQVTSESCSATAASASPQAASGNVGSCTFLLTDGQRFKCSGKAFSQPTPSARTLEQANLDYR